MEAQEETLGLFIRSGIPKQLQINCLIRDRFMSLISALFFLVATLPGMKIEEVIAYETEPHQLDLTIDENLHNGKILVLSDGSTWLVSPDSLSISASWVAPTPLKIEKSNDPTYPYIIKQIETPQSVLVRPIAPYKSGGLNIQQFP